MSDGPHSYEEWLRRHDEAPEFVQDANYPGSHVVDTMTGSTSDRSDGGLTAHRGVLHRDEYVDPAEVRRLVEEEVGFTIAEIRSVYVRRGGPVPKPKRKMRSMLDGKFLEIAQAGGNMTALSRILGIPYHTMKSAVARAREARA